MCCGIRLVWEGKDASGWTLTVPVLTPEDLKDFVPDDPELGRTLLELLTDGLKEIREAGALEGEEASDGS